MAGGQTSTTTNTMDPVYAAAAAMQTAGRASGLAGVSDASQASSTTRNLAASSGTNPYTSSGAQDGVNTALSGVTNAANTWVNMGKANSTSTETVSGGSGFGALLGTGAGTIGSWGLSKILK